MPEDADRTKGNDFKEFATSCHARASLNETTVENARRILPLQCVICQMDCLITLTVAVRRCPVTACTRDRSPSVACDHPAPETAARGTQIALIAPAACSGGCRDGIVGGS